jgi:hypothetical protein
VILQEDRGVCRIIRNPKKAGVITGWMTVCLKNAVVREAGITHPVGDPSQIWVPAAPGRTISTYSIHSPKFVAGKAIFSLFFFFSSPKI